VNGGIVKQERGRKGRWNVENPNERFVTKIDDGSGMKVESTRMSMKVSEFTAHAAALIFEAQDEGFVALGTLMLHREKGGVFIPMVPIEKKGQVLAVARQMRGAAEAWEKIAATME
jgi:hypothetical protein